MKYQLRTLILVLFSVLMSITIFSCSKDNEPDIAPDLDPQLIGTWEVKAALEKNYVHVIFTFSADGKMDVSAEESLLSDQPKKITGSGTWTAKEGVFNLKFTESNDPELIGTTKSIKYEIIADKLYIEYLPLFPFNRV